MKYYVLRDSKGDALMLVEVFFLTTHDDGLGPDKKCSYNLHSALCERFRWYCTDDEMDEAEWESMLVMGVLPAITVIVSPTGATFASRT